MIRVLSKSEALAMRLNENVHIVKHFRKRSRVLRNHGLLWEDYGKFWVMYIDS